MSIQATAFEAALVSEGASYTIPSGKLAIFCLRNGSGNTGSFLMINNVIVSNDVTLCIEWKPFCANAGEVIALSPNESLGTAYANINGLLF